MNEEVTKTYALEYDDRKTLPEDTIQTFDYDMKNGHLEAFELPGGNYIKISKIPSRVKTYWSSTKNRKGAYLLDESNRGTRILKQNKDGIVMVFQNFYIWTEGEISDIKDLPEGQRMLQIETSGVGGEITPLIANPSSDIFIDSVEAVSKIKNLENFGGGDNDLKLKAGESINRLLTSTDISKELNKESLDILRHINNLIEHETNTINNIDDKLNIIKETQANEEIANRHRHETITTMEKEIIDASKDFFVTNNENLKNIINNDLETLDQLKNMNYSLNQENQNSLNISTNIRDMRDRQIEINNNLETILESSQNQNEILNESKQENDSNLQEIKELVSAIPEIKENNNEGFNKISQKIDEVKQINSTLALETSIKELSSKLTTLSTQLDTQNILLQSISSSTGINYMPTDFFFEIKGANKANYPNISFLVDDADNNKNLINTCEMLSENMKNYNQKWFYTIKVTPKYVPGFAVKDNTLGQNPIMYHFGILSNYQVKFKINYNFRFRIYYNPTTQTRNDFLKEFKELTKPIPNLQAYNSEGDEVLLPISRSFNGSLSNSYPTLTNANIYYGMNYGDTDTIETSRYTGDITLIRTNMNYLGFPANIIDIDKNQVLPEFCIVEEYCDFKISILSIGERRIQYGKKK